MKAPIDLSDRGGATNGSVLNGAFEEIDIATGAVLWRFGGKKSNFAIPGNDRFAWQHDVESEDANTLRMFDNGTDGTITVTVTKESQILWFRINDHHIALAFHAPGPIERGGDGQRTSTEQRQRAGRLGHRQTDLRVQLRRRLAVRRLVAAGVLSGLSLSLAVNATA